MERWSSSRTVLRLSGLPETLPRVFLLTVLACGALRAVQPCLDQSAPGALRGFDRPTAIVPLCSITSRYRDNTQAEPDTQFTDSFLLAAVNTFLRFEVARRLNPLPPLSDSVTKGFRRVSTFDGPEGLEDSASAAAAHLADSLDAHLVVVALSCSLGYRVYQPEGWRNNAGPGYERPVEATGFARVQLQIRDSNGTVVYECVGFSTVDKPMLYRMFNGRRMRAKREAAMEEDVVRAAKRLYAPPIVRAIGRAVARAMPVR